jgi:uncharacterized membrane protein
VTRALVAVVLLVGCHAEDQFEDAFCPDEGTEHFGRDLVGSECQTCHATGAADRRGAPSHVTFDDLEQVREWAPRIYERSAGANVSMPPGPVDLELDVREDLAEWLVCGAPGED